ncbi:hypothetical protein CRG98_036300 [Punica granatum]|uniref:Uncharacterized protein n=1 Tax=Punica granatum TaxID=22663 RepID=A0A2I0IHX6_PUNGR|nr:hypothetical protein CRG98_036300 [Punica granatum]
MRKTRKVTIYRPAPLLHLTSGLTREGERERGCPGYPKWYVCIVGLHRQGKVTNDLKGRRQPCLGGNSRLWGPTFGICSPPPQPNSLVHFCRPIYLSTAFLQLEAFYDSDLDYLSYEQTLRYRLFHYWEGILFLGRLRNRQPLISRSSTKEIYHVMAAATSEHLCLWSSLFVSGYSSIGPDETFL